MSMPGAPVAARWPWVSALRLGDVCWWRRGGLPWAALGCLEWQRAEIRWEMRMPHNQRGAAHEYARGACGCQVAVGVCTASG